MKHVKRSDCQKRARGQIMECYDDIIEAEVLQNQIDQAWHRKECEETDRIKRETDASWKEYKAYKDDLDREDNSIAEIEEYFQSLEEEKQVELEDDFYLRDKKRSARRRASVYAKKRLITKSKNAVKNFAKRDEEDLKNLGYHSSEEFKSRVARCNALEKRANRLKR